MLRRAPALGVLLMLLVASSALPTGSALPSLGEAPRPDFVWSPIPPRSIDVVTLTAEGSAHLPVVLRTWTIETAGGMVHARGDQVEVVFGAPGVYLVTLNATDIMLRTGSVTRAVSVPNTPPEAAFVVDASPAFRSTPIRFLDTSTDIDGDAIVAHAWDLGDGSPIRSGSEVHHAFATLGTFAVTLVVQDSAGHASGATQLVRILNAPPSLAVEAPSHAARGEPVTFRAQATDPDGSDPVEVLWSFSDDSRYSGETVTRSFERAGNVSVSVSGIDSEGGRSAPFVFVVHVQ